MDILPDKLIFFLICTSFYLHMAEGPFQVVPIIVAVTVSAAGSLINKSIWRIGAVMAFVAASIYFKPLIFFLPLICMDLFLLQRPWFALLSVLPILYHIKSMDLLVPFQMLLLTLLAWLFARKAQVASIFREQAQRTRDDAMEGNLQLQKKQKDLLERQDYEMSVVRLKERNRIAREIHDNLGHQLSRAIIQLGALRIICNDQAAAGQIESLTATLTDGMN
ncbi:MAG: histidine kinase, partial [Eubacteriales bacterium]|nr:histidine kinase [Eubacteriales bacterium]